MGFLESIFIKDKTSKIPRKNERKVYVRRIYVFSETLEKIDELREIFKNKSQQDISYEIEQAEIYRKIIGIAYKFQKHKKEKSGNTYSYVKFITKERSEKEKR